MDSVAELSAWKDLVVEGSLTGGARNEIYRGQLHGQEVVIDRSTRCEESLRWELDLLDPLYANGCHVPEIVPAGDSPRRVHGRDAPLDSSGAARRELYRAVQCTEGWPKRTDAESARKPLRAPTRGNDVDIGEIPGALAKWKMHLQGRFDRRGRQCTARTFRQP